MFKCRWDSTAYLVVGGLLVPAYPTTVVFFPSSTEKISSQESNHQSLHLKIGTSPGSPGSLGSSKTSTVPHCQCWLFKNLHLGVSLHLVIICINHILSILGSCPLTTLSGFINLKCSAKVAFRAFYQHSSSMVHMIFCDLASGESFGHDWLKSSQLCIAIFWFFFINELYFIAFSHDG